MLLVKTLCALILAVFFSSTMAATPEKCYHTYALCIAAKCIKSGSSATCSCKVFDGPSYAYGGYSCENLKPSGDVVYSTYSTKLFANGIMSCPGMKQWADCMGARCQKSGSSASCSCKLRQGVPLRPQGTLGGNCNAKQNCSSNFVWSTANIDLLKESGASQCAENKSQ